MRSQSKLFVANTHKTKTWWIILSVFLFVFVPFLITWLLCGEFNLIDLNWIVPKNKVVWHGLVTDGNIDALTNKYWIFFDGGIGPLRTALEEAKSAGQSIAIRSYKMFFNPIVLAPLFGLLVWSFVFPIIFNATKVSGLDVLPFSFTLGMAFFSLIITGLIPIWSKDAYCWIVKFLIVLLVGVAIFLIVNKSTNKYLASRGYAYDIVLGYKSLDKDSQKAREELKTHIDIFKHQDGQDKTYIDVPEKEK